MAHLLERTEIIASVAAASFDACASTSDREVPSVSLALTESSNGRRTPTNRCHSWSSHASLAAPY